MKKIFTLICTLMGMASVANAATVDDLRVCKHSYVLVCDDYTQDGTIKRVAGTLFGDGFFLDVTGGNVATNKGKSNPKEITKEKDEEGNVIAEYPRYGEAFANKYGEYGAHYNSLRLKNTQDVIAMKVTAGSKLIFLLQGNDKTGKDARYPKIAEDAALTKALNDAPTADFKEKTSAGYKYEWTADDDRLIYIGSYNGDMFLGYIIVEAVEAAGTPMVKVSNQAQDDKGLWYRTVTCIPSQVEAEGEALSTIVTYTTDGTEPTGESPVYKEPIKCYSNMSVKFQAYLDLGDGTILDEEGQKLVNADNEGPVSFMFDAPTITANGANVTIESTYNGAKNFASYLDITNAEVNAITLTESATITAYSQIVNGEYATFTTKSVTKDVYVLNPIKEEKIIAVTKGDVILDEEATATSTNGNVYMVENGEISANKMDFFVKNLTFGVVKDANAAYQIDEKEAYIQMSNTNISFLIAEGDTVNVEVVVTKNSCKTLNPTNDEDVTSDRKCYVNVDGNTYGCDDITNGAPANLDGYKNVITFGLNAGVHTFQKYSGTGNIFVSSIKITPVDPNGIKSVAAEKKVIAKKMIMNGQLVVKTADGIYNIAGVRIK